MFVFILNNHYKLESLLGTQKFQRAYPPQKKQTKNPKPKQKDKRITVLLNYQGFISQRAKIDISRCLSFLIAEGLSKVFNVFKVKQSIVEEEGGQRPHTTSKCG